MKEFRFTGSRRSRLADYLNRKGVLNMKINMDYKKRLQKWVQENTHQYFHNASSASTALVVEYYFGKNTRITVSTLSMWG